MQTNPLSSSPFRSTRGSTLIVTMLLGAVISISLVSYLKLSNNSLKQANRTFYSNSAMNLAEVGLEEALYCFNQLDNVATATDAWPHATPVTTASPWTLNNTTYNSSSSPNTPYAVATFSGFDVGPNATGSVKVYVHHHTALAGATPVIVAKSTITQADGSPPISKYIEVTLRKRSLFANGLVARNNVSWVGHPMADSWDSRGDTQSPAIAYDPSIRTANAIVASISGNIGLAGGEVWGYTKTGEFGASTGGSVHPLGTTTNDPTRRTNDFNATFPNPTVPTPAQSNPVNSSVSGDRTFPAAGDNSVVVAGVTTYYYTFSASSNINIAGNSTVSIAAGSAVVFIMQGKSSATAISVSGNAGIDVNAGASLNVYTDGNISIAGNGMANDNHYAATTMFWGTNPTSQSLTVSGNGNLTAVFYAPNADVSLNGGGSSGLMNGAVVAKSITMNGGTEFHYDDALGRLTTGNPFGISKWRELQSATERATYATQLAY